MAKKERWLKARLRDRDKDIEQAIDARDLSYGEISDLVREGVRRVLFGRQESYAADVSEIQAEINQVEREPSPEELNSMLDDLINF